MFIKSLRICNTVTGAIMRETSFHKGVNLIVDTESSSRHNKVGKTTFLKLIDVLMGQRIKKGSIRTTRPTLKQPPCEISSTRNVLPSK